MYHYTWLKKNRFLKNWFPVHNVAPVLRLVFHKVVGEYINMIKTTFLYKF